MISGRFADKYGRRIPFLYASGITCIINFCVVFTTNIYQLIILRAFMGILVGFFGPLAMTLLAEIT